MLKLWKTGHFFLKKHEVWRYGMTGEGGETEGSPQR